MALLHLESLPRRLSKGDLLSFLAQHAGLGRRQVGRIDIQADRASVEIPDGAVSSIAKALNGQRLGDRRVRAWFGDAAPAAAAAGDHFRRLARLLDLESRAEAQRAAEQARRLTPAQAEASGNSLVSLWIMDEEAGLGGRYLVQLSKRGRPPLPWTRLDVGSPVVLSPAEHAHAPHRGVVCERSERSISVALDRLPEDLGDFETWRIDQSFDEVAIQRQRAALDEAAHARGGRFPILRAVLLGEREPLIGVEREVRPLDPGLNEPQREAVQLAMSAREVGLIHGPPGTGKTTTVVEVIRQAVSRGQKVLACAPSNLAVDNIFERLLVCGERAVRLGHPARVLPALREHTLDILVEKHRDVQLAHKLVKQAVSLFKQSERYTRAAPKPGHRKQLREDAKSLLADARRMEQQALQSILDSATALCATTTALDGQLLGDRQFDLVVIDEACQSTEPGCWIPILRGDRVVLAGDHCQLPPTILSEEAQRAGFGISLFERLIGLHGPQIAKRLAVQYRMHEAIMEFSSAEFYEGDLRADESVRAHVLSGLPGVAASPLTDTPLLLIDTAGAGYDEEQEPDGESRLNPQEAEVVVRKVQALLDAGVRAADIAVIAPYAAQVRLLRKLLNVGGLEIDSVDGFQGREKEAVVISLVRSNATGEIGFLGDVRRMNVAMTRARRKLVMVGDSATLAAHPFYERMLAHFERHGAYKSVWEEG